MTTEPTWIEALEDRTSYVLRLMRIEASDLDEGQPDNAFAFILGADEDNALVIEGTVSGDGGDAIATLWALRDGRKVPVSILEIDDQVMVTHALA